MKWSDVGDWLKSNAGTGAALVGSLLTGNLPGAVAAGVSLVSGATGTDDPAKALAELQANPETLVKLRELANQEQDSIRRHIADMKRMELEDEQRSHEQTQLTVRNGDQSESRMVRWTRPGQSWVSLAAAIYYALANDQPSVEILLLLLTLPWTYAGLREFGKGLTAWTGMKREIASTDPVSGTKR